MGRGCGRGRRPRAAVIGLFNVRPATRHVWYSLSVWGETEYHPSGITNNHPWRRGKAVWQVGASRKGVVRPFVSHQQTTPQQVLPQNATKKLVLASFHRETTS